MQAYPNNKPWAMDLVGFYERADWFNSGNVILWDDGTIWVYGSEQPSVGDVSWYGTGFSLLERKSGSDFWERLTPDVWGDPLYGTPPGYPNWPNDSVYLNNPDTATREAPLNVARFAGINQGEDNTWNLPPVGDEVIFIWNGGHNYMFPFAINKATRRWRVLYDEDPIVGLTTRTWWGEARCSNVVVYEDHYWFLTWRWHLDCNVEPDLDFTSGLQLVRAPISNIEDVRVIHRFQYSVGWLDGHITTDIDIPEFFNNGYVDPTSFYANNHTHIAMGDGVFYLFSKALVKDSRTSPVLNTPGAVNHDMNVGLLRQAPIGDWDNLKVVYYHSNQGWVGYSRSVSGSGSLFGTTLNGTIGAFSDPEGYGSGFEVGERWYYAVAFNNGFLYFWLLTGSGGNQSAGSPWILCRMDVSGLDADSPRAYERDNPYYEVIGNGTGDWEGSFSKRYWGYGTTLFMRYGSQAIYPRINFATTLVFDTEGGIWMTGFQYLFLYPFGPIAFNQGYPHRVLLRLRPSDNETRVTLTFTGTAYQGYTAVRETGSRTREIELELGSVQPV